MLFRVSALSRIGLFDERFFMYPEDIDISRRIVANFDTQFVPDATVTHLHAAESKRNFRMFLIHVWNMILYFNKWGWFIDKERQALNLSCIRQLEKISLKT